VSPRGHVPRADKAPPHPLVLVTLVHGGPEPRRPVHTLWTGPLDFALKISPRNPELLTILHLGPELLVNFPTVPMCLEKLPQDPQFLKNIYH
jgi:hypothetical protein